VRESFDWEHGVFLGSIMSSETTAAAFGEVGKLRFDPMGMLPFCGYNMADYWAHWLDVGRSMTADKRPHIFYVNWFRRDSDGRFLWPGFGENSRVLEWMFRRCDGQGGAQATAIGWLPTPADLDTKGLDISEAVLADVLTVDAEAVLREVPQLEEHFARFGDRLPTVLSEQLATSKQRLEAS
jgi:phosphoenolpyruvate carboxykinase (GTP)